MGLNNKNDKKVISSDVVKLVSNKDKPDFGKF